MLTDQATGERRCFAAAQQPRPQSDSAEGALRAGLRRHHRATVLGRESPTGPIGSLKTRLVVRLGRERTCQSNGVETCVIR